MMAKDLVKNGLKICLIANNSCSDQIINAHSVQNKKMLASIADDSNHVYRIDYKESRNFEKLSINKASTFRGFCSFHDNNLFTYIDNSFYSNLKSEKANFLYAFRALSREVYTKANVINYYKKIFKIYDKGDFEFLKSKFPTFDLSDLNIFFGANSFFRSMCYGNELGLKNLNQIFAPLFQSFSNENFNSITSLIWCFRGEPTLTASCVLSPEYTPDGDLVNDVKNLEDQLKPVFLSIVPDSNKTYVLFSFLRRDKKFFRKLTKNLEKLSHTELKKYLEILIINHCENVYFSEEYVKSLSIEEREKLKNIFMKTTYEVDLKESYSMRNYKGFNIFT